MREVFRSPLIKTICCYLALVMTGLIPVSREAHASFIPQQPDDIRDLDPGSLEALRTVLEHDLIAEKLSELGLSKEEILQRVEELSPEEREEVLANLNTVQAGGFVQFIIWYEEKKNLIHLFIGVWFLVHILMIVKAFPRGRSESKVKISKVKGIEFWEAGDVDFPPYHGEVEVFYLPYDPPEGSILVGGVDATRELDPKALLALMKKEAARNGADTLIFYYEEPSDDGVRFYWNARAMRTQDPIEN
jgi:hypothetical protein